MPKVIFLSQYDEYISVERLAEQLLQSALKRRTVPSSGNWIADVNANIDNERNARLAVDAKLLKDEISGELQVTDIEGEKVVLPKDLVRWAEINKCEVSQEPKPRREQSLVDMAYAQLLAEETKPSATDAPSHKDRSEGATETESKVWSQQKLLALLKRHQKLISDRERAPTKKLAAEYAITETRLRQLLQKARKLGNTLGHGQPVSPEAHAPFGFRRKD